MGPIDYSRLTDTLPPLQGKKRKPPRQRAANLSSKTKNQRKAQRQARRRQRAA